MFGGAEINGIAADNPLFIGADSVQATQFQEIDMSDPDVVANDIFTELGLTPLPSV